jgi:hypothetical protein
LSSIVRYDDNDDNDDNVDDDDPPSLADDLLSLSSGIANSARHDD